MFLRKSLLGSANILSLDTQGTFEVLTTSFVAETNIYSLGSIDNYLVYHFLYLVTTFLFKKLHIKDFKFFLAMKIASIFGIYQV